jgi:hypothetical protein
MSKETIEATVAEQEFAKADWAPSPDLSDEKNGHPAAPPAPARPAPTPPVDHLHLHRRFERLLVCLEQQGICVEDDLYNVRTSP